MNLSINRHPMKEEKSDISKLIELKKYEQPEEGFFEDFLADFQARQRQEMVKISARALLVERVSAFFKERSLMQWGAAAAISCAAVILTLSVFSQQHSQNNSAITITASSTPATQTPMNETVAQVTTTDLSSPLLAITDVEFAFIDIHTKALSEDVEF